MFIYKANHDKFSSIFNFCWEEASLHIVITTIIVIEPVFSFKGDFVAENFFVDVFRR